MSNEKHIDVRGFTGDNHVQSIVEEIEKVINCLKIGDFESAKQFVDPDSDLMEIIASFSCDLETVCNGEEKELVETEVSGYE